MNPRVNGTVLAAKTLVTLRKEGCGVWGQLGVGFAAVEGVRILLLLVAGGNASYRRSLWGRVFELGICRNA